MYDDFDDDFSSEKYDNKYDKIIHDWAIEEVYPSLEDYELEEMKELYGNRETGILYRGMSLQSEEELENIENIIKNKYKDTYFDFGDRKVSSTPHKDTADSFMHFTKSYIPSVMAQGMLKVGKTGCKSDIATVLLKFKVLDKSQVIFKNYHDEGEEELLLPSHTSETEVFLNGEVKVLDIEINYPLTQKTYKDIILKKVNKIEDLEHPSYSHWIKENLSEEQKLELVELIIKKIEGNYKYRKRLLEEFTELLYSEKYKSMINFNKNIFKLIPDLEDFIEKRIVMAPNFPILSIKLNNEYIGLNKEIDGIIISEKYQNKKSKEIKKYINNFKEDGRLRTSSKSLSGDKLINLYTYDMTESKNFYKFKQLLKYASKDKELFKQLISTDFFKENNKIAKKFLNKNLFEFNFTDIDIDKEKDKYKKQTNKYIYNKEEIEETYSNDKIKFFREFLYIFNDIMPFLITEKDLSNKMMIFFMNYVKTGSMDKNKLEFLRNYSEIMTLSLNKIQALNIYTSDFEDVIEELENEKIEELENENYKEELSL